VRYDDYTGFGSTTNPKVSLRFAPVDQLVMRGSYSTGFRVPTFNQLFFGITESTYAGKDLVDPAKLRRGKVSNPPWRLRVDHAQRLYRRQARPGPRREQAVDGLGVVWEPNA
jgi:iron complex outermembrane receptor protein